jgi:hypothetical protein
MEWFVQTPDGRTLAVEDAGDRDGRPVLVHVGTPNSRHLYGRTVADATARSLHTAVVLKRSQSPRQITIKRVRAGTGPSGRGERAGGLMNISVRYMRDFKRTYRCALYLRRKATMVLTSTGILVLLAAFLPSRSSQEATVVLAVIGIILLVEVPLVIWLMVIRNWDALNEEVEVTVTSEEIVQRTATTSLRLSWDMVQRIISLKDIWLFYASRLKVVTLYKGALTAAQQAELAAFIEARKRA